MNKFKSITNKKYIPILRCPSEEKKNNPIRFSDNTQKIQLEIQIMNCEESSVSQSQFNKYVIVHVE